MTHLPRVVSAEILPPFAVVVDDTVPDDEMWVTYQPDGGAEQTLVGVKVARPLTPVPAPDP